MKLLGMKFFEESTAGADYDMNATREEYIRKAKADGLRIVYPNERQLQIDIDSDEQYAVFKRGMASIERNWPNWMPNVGAIVVTEAPSRSGLPCRHITVNLPFDITDWQRIALQGALGSDPMRELLSSLRLMRGDVHPTLFTEAA